SRQQQKWLLQAVGHAVYSDLMFFHRFQQRCLSLGRGAVDFVCQHDLRHDRSGAEFKFAGFLVEQGYARHVRGEHVRRELNAAEGAADGTRQRFRHHGFADAGNILDENVPLTQQPQHRQPDFIALADDDLTHTMGDTLSDLLHNFDRAGTSITTDLSRFLRKFLHVTSLPLLTTPKYSPS